MKTFLGTLQDTLCNLGDQIWRDPVKTRIGDSTSNGYRTNTGKSLDQKTQKKKKVHKKNSTNLLQRNRKKINYKYFLL